MHLCEDRLVHVRRQWRVRDRRIRGGDHLRPRADVLFVDFLDDAVAQLCKLSTVGGHAVSNGLHHACQTQERSKPDLDHRRCEEVVEAKRRPKHARQLVSN